YKQSHSRQSERRSRRPVPAGEIPAPGLRYRAVLPAAKLQGFPSPFRALVENSQANFIKEDRGRNRKRNDDTFDSRAVFFRDWAAEHGLQRRLFEEATPPDLIVIMGQYLTHLLSGNNLKDKTDLADGTITGYLQAACKYLQAEYGVHVPVFHNNKGAQPMDRLDPYLSQLVSQRRIWGRKKPKREPLSGEMLEYMCLSAFTKGRKHP
ncbi:MAG: hypothetical protein SGILL_009959, partial [Bacillariaceae sp.]